MEAPQIVQLVAALLLTLAGLLMFIHRDQSPGFGRYKLAGMLFLVAAAVNWVLFFIRL